jgi:hypothetical protein
MFIEFLLKVTVTSIGAGFGHKLCCRLVNGTKKPDENRQSVYCALVTALSYLFFSVLFCFMKLDVAGFATPFCLSD